MGKIVNAIDYLEAQFAQEWERDYKAFSRLNYYGCKEMTEKFLKMDTQFYGKAKSTPALEAAVLAFRSYETTNTKKETKMEFKESNESGIDTKHFVKLKDGDSVVGIFRGDIHDFKQHWLEKEKHSVECIGEGCPHCAQGIRAGFRFRVNLITKENDVYVAKLFEQGWKVYEQLRSLNKDYPLEKAIVKITRNGKDNNTTYSILPLPKWEVPSDTEKKLEGVQLHDVKNLEKVAATAGDFNSDIPF